MALDIDSKYLTDDNRLNLAGFIQGKVGYSIDDLGVLTITTSRQADYAESAEDVDERTQDLCWADALILYLSKDSKSRTDGGTSESENISGYSKDEIKEFALYLYGKWGEDVTSLTDNQVEDTTYLW